jgi:hypothetical protein
MKIRQSRFLPPFGDIKPPSKQNSLRILPAFFGDRFVEKESGLRTYNPSAEEEDIFVFTQNFKLGKKFKNLKHIAVDDLTKTLQ